MVDSRRTSPVLQHPLTQSLVHPPRQTRVGVYPHLRSESVLIQPLHQRQIQTRSSVEVLRRVNMEVREGWEEEGMLREPGDEGGGGSVQQLGGGCSRRQMEDEPSGRDL